MIYFRKNLNLSIGLRYYFFTLFIFLLPFCTFAQNTSQTESSNKQTTHKTTDLPVSILIILDLSSSMKSEPKMNKKALESLSDFVGKSNTNNEYFIVGISSTPKILLDAGTGFEDTQKIILKIKKQKYKGASAFFDTCFLGVEKISQGQYSKKIVLILSDGVDNISEKTLDELLVFLKNEKVIIYAINVNAKNNETSLQGSENLNKIISTTGGKVYNVEKSEEIESTFDDIRKRLQP